MRFISPVSTLTSLILCGLLFACGDDADPMTDAADDGGLDAPPEGRAITADALCDELSTLACTVHERCCGGVDAGEDATCEERQLEACERSIAPLLTDPRLAYVPERGGAFLDGLAAQADTCFTEPPRLEDFLAVFAGTGVADADCTPPSAGDDVALRVSQLSCVDGLACHLYRRSDGSPLGVCEARTDGDCSHRFDCAAGQWCNLPAGWEPGRWGRCQPLKADGWTCASDLECGSRFCDSLGTCAAPHEQRYCAALTYEGAVLAHQPVGYWRLGEGSGVAVGRRGGIDGVYEGSTTLTGGAIADDADGALALDDASDAVAIPEFGAELSGDAVTLEAWFRRTEASMTGPIIEFADGETFGIRLWNHNAADKVHANFADRSGMGFATTSEEGLIAADTWYHVVATHDGSVGRVYVNGERVGEDIMGGASLQTAGDLHIGQRVGDERHILGAIDEVAIYDRPLSRAQIRQHASLGAEGPAAQDFVLFRWLR